MAITVQYPAGAKLLTGTWTHTVGAAPETLVVNGHIWDARFTCNLSSGKSEPEIKWSDSLSGIQTTITLYCNSTVTDGRFVIVYTPF